MLALATQCAAAPGIPAVPLTSTFSGGFIFDGTRMWVTDASKGLCRMDPVVGGGSTLTNCILPPTGKPGVQAVLGQPAFSVATQSVYLPDMSTGSKGIWRYSFNGLDFNSNPGVNIASAAGLGSLRPGAVALGDDANLYATMTVNSSYVRVNTPAGAAQTVDKMGTTLSGKPARGLTFVASGLWIADVDGELLIPGAAVCGTKCRGALNTQAGVPNPLSITFDALNGYIYIGTSFGVFQHNRVTGQTVLYSKFWSNAAGASGLLTDVTAVGVDNVGNLYYADDPTASQVVGGATVYSVPAGSAADGQGNLGSPPPTIPPFLSAAPASANPALLYATGLTTPKGAVFMGTHVWVVDGAKGFCRVDPALPAPLTNCAVLPVGFVPGSPAYDKATNLVYLPDTTAAGQGIVRLQFTLATETVGAAIAVVPATVLTTAAPGTIAPTAVAVGPDGELYAAMAGTSQILRVATPAGLTHKVTVIGSFFDKGIVGMSFLNSDLWAVEVQDAATLFGATLCTGNCTSLFFGQSLVLPTAVYAEGTEVYIALGQKVMVFDSVANVFASYADTGLVNGVPTSFNLVTGLTSDGQGHIFAADSTNLWQIATTGALPTVTALAPSQAPESSTQSMTITGTNFNPTSLVVSTCAAITPGNVTVVSPTQITATFAINPVGPLGPCNVTVTTGSSASIASAASSFTVLVGPPALTTITTTPASIPASAPSGFRGRSIPVSIAGANMTLGAINPIPGITITGSVVTDTLITATFVIDPTAALGPQSVTITTPSGPSNAVIFTINAAPPALTGMTPASAVAVRTPTVALTLNGTDLFGAAINPPAGFTISGVPVVTTTSITATLAIAPTVPAGPQSITVLGPGGASNAMTFMLLPALASIAPVTARAGDTTVVTLTGNSLAGVTSINAGLNITVTGMTVVNSTITATFASALNSPLGPQSVTVTDAGGITNAVTFTLTAPVPVLTGIAPLQGAAGASVPVTLAGSGLVGAALNLPAGITLSGTPVVTFNQITATLVIADTAPLGAQSITVTTPGGTSLPVTFTVFAPVPTLASVAPAQGVANTTVAVTFTGTGLIGSTLNLPAGFTLSGTPVITGTSITASLVIASTVSAGPQTITATTTGGASNTVTFTILPALTGIAPIQARAGASTAVTLTGTSLAGVASVNAGPNITVTNVVVSANQITATFASAAGAPVGPASVTVTDANGTSVAVTFTLTGPVPTIASISPATGGTGATVPITITGTGLTLGTLNLPAGITLSGAPVVSFTQITANLTIAGNAPLGSPTITVTTPGTGSTSNAVTFTVFAAAPLINANGIAPGTATAGTTIPVTLTGQGFTGTTSVNTGAGITVQSFTIVSGSQINATFIIDPSALTQLISVTNPNGTSTPVTFGIVPTLSGIATASSPAGLSVFVTLTGTSLTGATSINPNPAGTAGITITSPTVVSSTQITATFVIAAGATLGNRNITVTTPGGTTSAVVFNVLPPPPSITKINAAFKRGSNQGVTLQGAAFTGANDITSVQVFLNGIAIPLVVSAQPVNGSIIVPAGSFATSPTLLRWSWTIPASLPASSGIQVYTLTVTTPSGTTAPFGFSVQ